MTTLGDNILNDEEKVAKITELQDIIATAEETMLSAKHLLANLQPENINQPMPIHNTSDEEDNSQIIYGFFDGQIMIGDDGKQYPVPANYASKSKLVEGDKLKLTITENNKFVYKQIGPIQRNYLIGIVKKDERGNFTVQTQDKEYKVLLAAATYFKIEPNDEVTLIVPQNGKTIWGAIENVLQKNTALLDNLNADIQNDDSSTVNDPPQDILKETSADDNEPPQKNQEQTESEDIKLSAIEKLEEEIKKERKNSSTEDSLTNTIATDSTPDNNWEANMEQVQQEANVPITSNS